MIKMLARNEITKRLIGDNSPHQSHLRNSRYFQNLTRWGELSLANLRKLLSLLCFSSIVVPAFAEASEKISYNEKIRPIFNMKCAGCHGGVKKNAGVSFIYREEALGVSLNGNKIIVAGEPENSEVVKRITSKDPRYVMPPAHGDHKHEPLSHEEIELIKEWIAQGAEWEEHWAYIKPAKVAVAPVQKDWIQQPMDAYVLDRLEKNDLKPTAEAPKGQWLRRVSFDLTGLPPSTEELKAFLADESEDAYEKVVDRLLASQRYGERWAAMWMDIARYADTKGYEKDGARHIWPYRNWLIESFNKDLPYKEFIQDQLAGDLVDKPSWEQLMATGFIRLTQTNTEGGTNDEEFRVEAVMDRINTTWVAFQGITYGCIQCHSHPYEPIPHEDYYKYMTFFDSTEDCDLDDDYPTLKWTYDPAQRQKVVDAQLKIIELKNKVNDPGRMEMQKAEQWKDVTYSDLHVSRGGLHEKDGLLFTSGSQPQHVDYGLKITPPKGLNVTALKVSILPDEDDPAKAPFKGAFISHMDCFKIDAAGKKTPLLFNAVFADSITGPHKPALNHGNGRVHNIGGFPKLFKQRDAVMVLKTPMVLADNERIEVQIKCRNATTGSQGVSLRKFQFKVSDSGVWAGLSLTEEQKSYLALLQENEAVLKDVKAAEIPVALERTKEATRETRLFIGGNRLNKGEAQTPGVPEILNSYNAPVNNRLEMAKWMSHPENPLTSRVFVNRIFSELFGYGIVETLGDFGTTGLAPTNLALLDHLALAFQNEYQWKLKPLLKELVLSATYRQDHKATPELAAEDPKNQLLARGPRTRLSAEMIRDNALAVSGLLKHRYGGGSVFPPQPAGVWSGAFSGDGWKNSKGDDRYRRALYTYWKRTAPYPSLMTFDSSARDVCNIQRITTNTPLQPLITLNDPAYLECAQKIAEGMMVGTEEELREKIAEVYTRVTQSTATEDTLNVLQETYKELQETYKTTPYGTLAKSPEAAALVNIASIILNIDKTISK